MDVREPKFPGNDKELLVSGSMVVVELYVRGRLNTMMPVRIVMMPTAYAMFLRFSYIICMISDSVSVDKMLCF